jgi:L-aminopeptidase/D-esterase-like protein
MLDADIMHTAALRARISSTSFGTRVLPLGHQAVVGDLEDRGLAVLVDRDDGLAALHAGEVLDRARDRDGDVEVGRDDLAGLSDL